MSKVYDAIMGLAVGDALGVPVEFKKRDTYKVCDMTGYGTYNQPPGTWSDDSSMTFATMESIARLGKIDTTDIMKNFLKWYRNKEFTPHREVFDIGCSTRMALERYESGTDIANCGGNTPTDNGNGGLMRILPVAFLPENIFKQLKVLDVVKLTHAHVISKFGCLVYVAIAENLLNGIGKYEAVARAIEKYKSDMYANTTLSVYERLEIIHKCSRNEIKSSGYVVDTLEAAIWCFLNTNNYRECVLTAVNLGTDTDTITAIAGGLAGILYGCGGETGIPEEWIAQIARKEWIEELCEDFSKVVK